MSSSHRPTLHGITAMRPFAVSTAATLSRDKIYVVVNSRMNCCHTVLVGAPRTVTDAAARCYRHWEVWSRPWSDTARPTALARRSRPGSLHWQFTSVWTAAHHRLCRSTASRSPVLTRGVSAFRQRSPTCRTAFPAQHLRPSGVLSC